MKWSGGAVALAVFACCAAAHAAQEPLYLPGTDSGSFTEGQGNSRDTHFRALDNLNIFQIGVRFDPLNDSELNVGTADGSITLRWRIYASDDDGRINGAVFDSGNVLFADAGLKTYNTNVATSLAALNYYVLSLQVTTGGFAMPLFHESTQSLPLLTSDANFRVLNGGNNNINTTPGFLGNFSNVFLPAFSVTVPEPSSLALVACAAMLLLRRR